MPGRKIDAVGAYADLKDSVPEGVAVTHYEDCLMCAGFIDTHIHYVQTGIIGAFGAQLIDWLNHYTFIAEQRFGDQAHAAAWRRSSATSCLRNGTTTGARLLRRLPAVRRRLVRGVRAARHAA